MRLKDTGLSKQEFIDTVDHYMIGLAPRFQMIADAGEGMTIYDEEDGEYLDFYGGIAVSSVGNCNEKVVAAIKEQCEDLIHGSNYPYTVPQGILAKYICETIGMEKIFFQNSGSEANEAAIKMARKYGVEKYGKDHYEIVTAYDSFHGRTYGALSATGQPNNGCQIGYHPVLPGFTYAEYNNLESFKAACTENTIAIMLEPVMAEGGVYPATEEFLKGIREFCDEKGMLLIFDEVQTGWGRTGAVMGYLGYGVKPDIVTMAKAMGGGMPISAIAASKEVSDALIGGHGSTYAGNPVCCAASLAAVTEIVDRDLAANAAKMGAYFMDKLKDLPHVKEVRGRGLLVGVEFDEAVTCGEVKHQCMEKRMLITAIGHNTIRMVPPLVVTKEEIDRAIDILTEAILASEEA